MEQNILDQFKKKTHLTGNYIVAIPDEFDEEPSVEIMETEINGKVYTVRLSKDLKRIIEIYQI